MEKKKKKINLNFEFDFVTVAIILIAIFCVSITPITFQNDTYYTIKIGELIKNNGIDMMDHFSWHTGLPYTYPHWLYDFLTYFIYSFSGFKGIYITTCVLAVILGLSMYFVNSKLSKSNFIAFVVTAISIYFLKPYITARAQLVTFILFTWEIYCIEKFIENKKIKYAISLLIISLLIANLHCATWPFFFVLALPYIAEYLIAIFTESVIYNKDLLFISKFRLKRLELKQKKYDINSEKYAKFSKKIEGLKNKIDKINIDNENKKNKVENIKNNPYKLIINKNNNVKILFIIMVICVLMGFLTPLKDTPFTYLTKTLKGNTMKSISEHLPLVLAENNKILITLGITLCILVFTKVKIRLSDVFMLGGLCYLMLSSRRQASMFILIGSIIFTRLIIDLVKTYMKDGFYMIEEASKNILVITSLTVLFAFLSFNFMKAKKDDKFVDETSYPVSACDYILENIDLTNAKFYNEYNYGSYMLFRGIPVFIDSRADLYSPEFSGDKEHDIFTDFIDTSSISKFYEDTFKKYDITHVLIRKKSKTNMVITKTHDENFKELYSDDNFVLYERVSSNN